MRKNVYLRNILLAAVVGIAMLAMMVYKVFLPGAVLPELNIPNFLVLISLALVLNHYLGSGEPYCWICSGLLAAETLGLLPWAAGMADISQVWKLALVGGSLYVVVNFLFDSISERLRSGPAGKAAALITGMLIVLAGQSFAGILL